MSSISFVFYGHFLGTIMQRKSNQCFLKKRKRKKKQPMVSTAHEAQCECWAPFASKENEWNKMRISCQFCPIAVNLCISHIIILMEENLIYQNNIIIITIIFTKKIIIIIIEETLSKLVPYCTRTK